MILSKKLITKAPISLRGFAGWSARLLFAKLEDRFSRVEGLLLLSQKGVMHLLMHIKEKVSVINDAG